MVEANDLAQGALRPYTQCRWIGHTTFQLRGGTLPPNYRHSSEIFFANALVSGDVVMRRWGVTEEPTIGDKRLS